MFARSEYQLLDFGRGRKLEQFGSYVLDRPCPAADDLAPRLPDEAWRAAAARYERTGGQRGNWSADIPSDGAWCIRHASVKFELKLTPFGHVGVFPEQAAHWDWVAAQTSAARRALRLLNLFAYTGGSTLAASAAGAAVVHVDAAENTVAWARRNAELSGLAEAPIRWIAEDAVKFAGRELKRGNQYDAVVLDPPSYGHGPDGETWSIEQHMSPLLAVCAELTARKPVFMLLTCHSPELGPAELEQLLAAAFGRRHAMASGRMCLATSEGRQFDCGAFVRISANP